MSNFNMLYELKALAADNSAVEQAQAEAVSAFAEQIRANAAPRLSEAVTMLGPELAPLYCPPSKAALKAAQDLAAIKRQAQKDLLEQMAACAAAGIPWDDFVAAQKAAGI